MAWTMDRPRPLLAASVPSWLAGVARPVTAAASAASPRWKRSKAMAAAGSDLAGVWALSSRSAPLPDQWLVGRDHEAVGHGGEHLAGGFHRARVGHGLPREHGQVGLRQVER